MADHVSDKQPRPEKTMPQPARPADGEGTGEAHGETGERPRPRAPDHPASVRETMRPARRYDPGGDQRPFAPRRRKPGPERSAPPSAREFTHPLVAEVQTRQVEMGDEVWTVVVKGSGTVGSGRGRSARVLSIGFEAPGERPDPEGTCYLVANRLEDVDEEVLRGLVAEVDRNPDVTSELSRRRRSRGRGRLGRRNS